MVHFKKLNINIDSLIGTVDYAFLDGTFYDAEEINHRDIRNIPHPFIIEYGVGSGCRAQATGWDLGA